MPKIVYLAAAAALSILAFDPLPVSAQVPVGKWQVLANSPDDGRRHDDIFFINASTGWLVNLRGEVWRTDDGGDSWARLYTAGDHGFRSVGFTNGSKGWAGAVNTPGKVLFETTDGGTTWTNISMRIRGPTVSGICGIAVVSSTVVYAVGAFFGEPHFVRTLDGGRSWTSIDLSSRIGSLVDVHFFNQNRGFIVGGSGADLDGDAVILGTFDGGTTWYQAYRSRRAQGIVGEWGWKISFPDASHGFVSVEYNVQSAAPPAKFLVTSSGGSTWSERTIPGSVEGAGLQGIGFITPVIGYASGRGTTSMTIDGGHSWQQLADYSDANPNGQLDGSVNRIRVLSDTLAYAAGRRVYRYRTSPTATTIVPREPVPAPFTMEQNYPNPFGPHTNIRYTLRQESNVRMRVIDLLGSVVRILVNETQQSGAHEVAWDGRDDAGDRVASGTYMYLMDIGMSPEMKRMVVVR